MLSVLQRRDRLRRRIEEMQCWTLREAVDLRDWRVDGAPIAPGAPWPDRDGVLLFEHDTIRVPQDWPLEEARLELDLGGEGLVRLDGEAGETAAFGHDPNHRRYPLPSRAVAIRAECVARLPFGIPNRDPKIALARLVRIEPGLEAFVLRLTQLAELVTEIEAHDAAPGLLEAAEGALRQLDWPTSTADYVARVAPSRLMQEIWRLPDGLDPAPPGLDEAARASVLRADEQLRTALRDLSARYPQTGALALTGHAHIDLAWLWPMAETRRKARRSFSTMVALMDRFPEFRFNHSTAQLYQWIEEDDPALFARIREKVEAGQWEPVGGMWVEPDLNMPTGESLARQLIYGQRYFERSFGRRHRVAWLPDCFGFSPGLPQLLRQAGIDSLMTIKVNWSETNRMPHDLFWWEGLDGSRVLVHTFDNPGEGYNALIEPRSTLATWRNYRGKHRHPESLLSFGFGDGGGGPTEEMLTRTRQLADFPVVPALRQVKVEDFFASAQERGADLPVWLGEIYLEYHRGTFTTQGRTKRLHRQAERALIGAEALGALAALGGGAMPAPLHETWQVLLRNQFHDILPGSSIREVHAQAEDELASVIAAADAAAERALDELAQRLAPAGDVPAVLAVNPDLRPRPIRLAAPHPLPGGQPVEGGSVLCGGEVLPGLSAALVTGGAKTGALEVAQDRLENAFLRVTFGRDGTIASLYDKQAGREVLADRGNQIWAYVDKPRDFDAWELDAAYRLDGEELRASDPPQIVERGPHRAALRIRRRFRDSEIVQEVRLWANSPRLEFATDFDWHDRRILVKALMPLAIRADHATFECAHGVLRRPTHGNTSWDAARYEGAGHRFVDLSEHGYGVALLNDGRYGHHALGGELGLTLLRAPVYPDPLADEGAQHLRYALLPHAGDWMSGGVLAEAEDFNRPLYCRPVTVAADAPRLWQGVRAGGLATALSGFKPAEAGDALVLRVYEPAGARGDVALGLPPGWRVGARLSLLEDPLPEAAPAGAAMGPFEVRTLRIERDE